MDSCGSLAHTLLAKEGLEFKACWLRLWLYSGVNTHAWWSRFHGHVWVPTANFELERPWFINHHAWVLRFLLLHFSFRVGMFRFALVDVMITYVHSDSKINVWMNHGYITGRCFFLCIEYCLNRLRKTIYKGKAPFDVAVATIVFNKKRTVS